MFIGCWAFAEEILDICFFTGDKGNANVLILQKKKPIQEKSRGWEKGKGKPKKQQLVEGSLIKPEGLLPNDQLQNHLFVYPNRFNGWQISEKTGYKPVLSFFSTSGYNLQGVSHTKALHVQLLWPSNPILVFIYHFSSKLE